jgi:hypothetical protein
MLNNRRQILIQDEVTASQDIQWRMHTNATITLDGTTANLELDNEKMQIILLEPPAGATFDVVNADRDGFEPVPGFGDQPNDGVRVLRVQLPAGTHTLQVLFNPQWPDMKSADFVTPPTVPLDNWTLTSHD